MDTRAGSICLPTEQIVHSHLTALEFRVCADRIHHCPVTLFTCCTLHLLANGVILVHVHVDVHNNWLRIHLLRCFVSMKFELSQLSCLHSSVVEHSL